MTHEASHKITRDKSYMKIIAGTKIGYSILMLLPLGGICTSYASATLETKTLRFILSFVVFYILNKCTVIHIVLNHFILRSVWNNYVSLLLLNTAAAILIKCVTKCTNVRNNHLAILLLKWCRHLETNQSIHSTQDTWNPWKRM